MKICPNCQTENDNAYRFCLKCRYQFPEVNIPATRTSQPNPLSQAAVIGGMVGIIGGGLTILGWIMPWFSLGGIANFLLGAALGSGSLSRFLNLGGGIGSGLQLTLLSLVGGFAVLTDSDTFLFGILSLIVCGVLITIPWFSALNIRTGIRILEIKPTTEQALGQRSAPASLINSDLHSLRNRSTTVFVLMVIIFLFISAIPFGTAVLGNGFYLTMVGAVCTFIGAIFSQRRMLS